MRRVQHTGIGQYQVAGLDADLDLVGVVAEHGGVVFGNEAGALFMGPAPIGRAAGCV